MTPAQLRGLLAQETDEVYLLCLTITHPTFAAPYLLVADQNELVRAAGTFTPFAFALNLPNQDDDIPQVQVQIDNVDNAILVSIRNLPAGVRPQMLVEVVTAAEPDELAISPLSFGVLSINYDESQVTATIGFTDDLMDSAFPLGTYTPTNSPGLFL